MLKAATKILQNENEVNPAGYFGAFQAMLDKSITNTEVVNKETATSLVYLLDVVAPFVPQGILRSYFTRIVSSLAPALTLPDADAPLLRPAIGCLATVLVAQNAAAWEQSQTQISPRRALAGILRIALDHRPKVRRKAQEAITNVLRNPPPSPSVDHPAADMCAETALQSLSELAERASQGKKQRKGQSSENEPSLIHALQLTKTVAAASGGWPSKKIESLCELLLNISRSSNEFLTMASFEVFELIFEGMASDAASSAKLPRLLEVISDLRPSQDDSQLLPPWIAVLSRGYDVSAQIEPEDTFAKLPDVFAMVSTFLASSSHNIRVSASECLISFMTNCIPPEVILEPSVFDEKTLEKLAKSAIDLLSIKYQSAWMESFNVFAAMFENLRWRSYPLLAEIVKTIGDLRGSDAFTGKKKADEVLGKAIRAMGPENVLAILPLNIATQRPGQPGRAWLLPILRDYVSNTNLRHFRTELVPLSEIMFQRVINHGKAEKTMEVKIFETVVQQIWALLPGYCDLPLDLTEAFDQTFAEMLATLLYEQVQLRADVCRALQTMVESNKAVLEFDGDDDLLRQSRVSKAAARRNLEHLAGLSSNLLAVLFNVYSETLPHHRGYILQCINAYLSITPAPELEATFKKVTEMLEKTLGETVSTEKPKQGKPEDKMPPVSHTLMDLVITMSIYLPRESFSTLFAIASQVVMKNDDPQLQKKAYKLIPRLAESEIGQAALLERNADLQLLLLSSAEQVSAPAKRDRLSAIATLIPVLSDDSLHFIPSILSEVVLACKEVNERARTTAFDVLVLMAERIIAAPGVQIDNSKVPNMPDDAPAVVASLEEYLTMLSAGLAGSSPHMVSASITALTRVLYEFRESLSKETLDDLVQTLDLFLTSNNREIVRSVLGFVKVCVISLPKELMLPRLKSLIPNLMVWSHEHKAHFKAKVKHILERMIRKFGVDIVMKFCPEEDKKLITNIRKTKERSKRHAEAAKAAGDEGTKDGKRQSRFESEYDEAVADSDDESNASDVSDDEVLGRNKQRSKTYIVEEGDEPLDLLDRKSLANISSTKPSKQRLPKGKSRTKTDLDGKLLLGGDDDGDDQMVLDTPAGEDSGIGAYVQAIEGRDAVKRGQKGRLKFSNKRNQSEMDLDDDDDDEEPPRKNGNNDRGGQRSGRGGQGGRGGRGRGSSGRGGIARGGRRSLDGQKSGKGGGARGGRVMKSTYGKRN